MCLFPCIAKTWQTWQLWVLYCTATPVFLLPIKPLLTLSPLLFSVLLTLVLPLVSPQTLHRVLFRPALSLAERPKQTAADRRWIKTDQMGQSFGAVDGQRGGRVKGSCLIIQGSSLIMSKSKVKELFLIWHWLKKRVMQYWSRWQSP